MDQRVFSKAGEEYLSNHMCISVHDLNTKIFKDASSQLAFFKKLIDTMIVFQIPNNYWDPQDIDKKLNYDNEINKKLLNLAQNYNIHEHTVEYNIFDNLRYAFISYKSGGLYDLYKYREAESWYPQIIIRTTISPNDIHTLNNEVQIYRGTSKEEYNSKSFSQSWTLDKQIAEKFAFLHYQEQTNYQDTIRVVLETTVKKNSIYYYKEDDDEQEIILDERVIDYNFVTIIEDRPL